MTEQASLVGALRAGDPHSDELDALIDRRAREAASERDRANAEEEGWRESTRIYNGECREARRHMWVHYYRTLARNHAGLSERFAEKAAGLEGPDAA